MGLSSFASRAVEDVTATGATVFFQVYWCGSRDDMTARLARARAAGARGAHPDPGLVLRPRPRLGEPMDPRAPQPRRDDPAGPRGPLASRVAVVLPEIRAPADAGGPEHGAPRRPAPTFFQAYGEWMQTAPPTWADVAWLRAQWEGPFMVKGVCRVDDARRVVDAGASALSVSNHGGNNLDGTPATIRVLAGIADAVGGQSKSRSTEGCAAAATSPRPSPWVRAS